MQEFPHQLVLDGRVAGSWRREMTDTKAIVTVKAHNPLNKRHVGALARQAEALGRFFGRSCRLDQAAAG